MTGRFRAGAAALALVLPALAAADWPMLGGRPERNMVSPEKGLPLDWEGGGKKPNKNLKWKARLGQVTFGNPVISGGRVFIGTDHDGEGHSENRGVLKCFSERDGSLLWQVAHEKLEDVGQDDDTLGICSTPCVVDERVYYVSNRGELVCRDAKDGRALWTLDMLSELGVHANQASASSPLVAGELVFVVTGQGTDYRTGKVKNPAAPSFIAVNRQTGKLVWQDNSPGGNILTGQWGSPGYGVVDGRPQVVFPGGDGWLYSFEPTTGRLLWKFNCKAHEKTSDAGEPETMFNLVGAPVFADGRVFIAIGEPEASAGPGALRCLDARQLGDVTKTAELWRLGGKDFNDSISTVAVHDGLIYATDSPGFLICADAATGQRLWAHDLRSNIWGSPLVADGKVYLQVADGVVWIFEAGREKKIIAQNSSLPDLSHGTPVVANGVLYLTGQKYLYAIATE